MKTIIHDEECCQTRNEPCGCPSVDLAQLEHGAALAIEDLSCTMKITTYQFPVKYGLLGRLWKNLTCKHKMFKPLGNPWMYSLLPNESYCLKCGLIR